MMEAMVIHDGIRLAVEKEWSDVEIKSDSKVVIGQIKGGALHWRIIALLVNI